METDRDHRYRIRTLSGTDATSMREMLAMLGAAFEDAGTYMAQPPDLAYLAALLSDLVFIAIEARSREGASIGGLTAYALPKYEQARIEFDLYDLAVTESFRRRGIASALIEELKRVARKRGASVIFVQADRGDGPVIALYETLGVPAEVLHVDIVPGSA